MQKHFAVVTGIAMLAVAGVVVQQSGFMPSSLQGYVSSNPVEIDDGEGPSSSSSSTALNLCPPGGESCWYWTSVTLSQHECCYSGQECNSGLGCVSSSSSSSAEGCATDDDCEDDQF